MLQYGAHIDQPDEDGHTPYSAILHDCRNNGSDIHILNYITLSCLCARVINTYKISYKNQVPKTLENFVKLHEP